MSEPLDREAVVNLLDQAAGYDWYCCVWCDSWCGPDNTLCNCGQEATRKAVQAFRRDEGLL